MTLRIQMGVVVGSALLTGTAFAESKRYKIPFGYEFHGQVFHYPALVLLGRDGKELFRYVGKNNVDRYSFDQLKEKVAESREKK